MTINDLNLFKSRLPNLKREDLNYTAIALSRANYLPSGLKAELHKALLYGDIVAACGVAAVDSFNNCHDLRQARNTANRYIYRTLRDLGYRRERKSSTYSDSEDACSLMDFFV